MDTQRLKQLASVVRGLLKRANLPIGHSQSLDAIAAIPGLRNWPEVVAFPERVAACDLDPTSTGRLAARLKQAFDIDMPADELFSALQPSVAAPIERFFQARHGKHNLASQLVPRLAAVFAWFSDAGLVERKFAAAIEAGSDPEYAQNLSEMLVAYRLHQHGFALKRSPRKGGPDFIATKDGVTIQVEVITPQPLPEVAEYLNRPKVSVFTVPLQHFLMNWTKGVAAKVKQLLGDGQTKGWRDKNLVDSKFPFVIAVNGCLFATALDEGFFRPPIGNHPWAATGLYALSDATIRFDRQTGKRLWSGFEFRKELMREDKGAIPLDTFLDPTYASVSAVWAMSLDDFDLLHDDPEILSRQRYASAVLHNPNAEVALTVGHLPAYEEWTVMPNEEGYEVTRVKNLVPRAER